MLELTQQSWQPLNLHKPNPTEIGARFEEAQHPRFQRLADKMQARMTNANSELDQNMFKRFCERVLPVTFLDWIGKY